MTRRSIAFAVSPATVIATRKTTVLGWAEPVWTMGAELSRAVELGAIATMAAMLAFQFAKRRNVTVPTIDAFDLQSAISR